MNPRYALLLRLKKIGDEAWIIDFLDLLARLIRVTGVKPDDPRIAFNLVKGNKRYLRISLNNRLVLSSEIKEKQLVFRMILPESAASFAETLPGYLPRIDTFAEPRKAILTMFKVNEKAYQNDELLRIWEQECKATLELATASMVKKYHNPELYQMAVDATFRATMLEELQRTSLQELEEKAEETKYETPAFWGYQPNYLGGNWEIFLDKGVMAVPFGGLDFQGMNHDAIAQAMGKNRNTDNHPTSVNYLVNEIQTGDLVFAIKGSNQLLAVGEVTSDYQWKSEALHGSDFKSFRTVKWYPISPHPLDKPIRWDILWHLRGRESEFMEYLGKADPQLYQELFDQKFIPKPAKNTEKMNSNQPLNQILFGPPGTGKTFHTINKAVSIVEGIPESELQNHFPNRKELHDRFDELVAEGQIWLTTFHQSLSYEDFVEGIKPDVQKDKDGKKFVSYDVEEGVFKRLCGIAEENYKKSFDIRDPGKADDFEIRLQLLKDELEESASGDIELPMKKPGHYYHIEKIGARSIYFRKSSGTSDPLSIQTLKEFYYGRKENPFKNGNWIYFPGLLNKLKSYKVKEIDLGEEEKLKRYVLIIDEINRGNVSQVFGELITLLEEDKRLGKPEALEITLPYSKEPFSVPPNLYIVATMNTADRSVEALDTALRRRFTFREMPPRPELLADKSFQGIDLQKMLETINLRIEKLIDKDHCLGHSFFMKIDDFEDKLEFLQDVFAQKIIPQLQEYFFGDFGKIGLVLGAGFVRKKKSEANKKDFFAHFDYPSDLKADLYERAVWEFSPKEHWTNEAFIRIYDPNFMPNSTQE